MAGALSPREVLYKLRREKVRLKTFATWPVRWGYLDPQDLARAGFFYVNEGCSVQCAFCLGVIREWFPMDEPMAEHRRRFSRCPFVLGLPTRNVRIEIATGHEIYPKLRSGDDSDSGYESPDG
jgi:hypothetical protein